jgi:hypothetical protein
MFFRSSSLMPDGYKIVLDPEFIVPTTLLSSAQYSDISGVVDYAALVAKEDVAGKSRYCFF